MKLLMVVALFTIVAQLVPSCGGENREIVGWVQEKIERGTRSFIVIDQVEYVVPRPFWLSVDVGDLVKFDGTQWSIVKKAGT